MSMFYCTSHDRMEDSDFVGYQVTEAGEEVCDEAGDEEDPSNETIWYNTGWLHRRSSAPFHLTGPNGLNFARSLGVKTSRLERVRDYLRKSGPSTKAAILRDVFNRPMSRSWGSTFFRMAVRHGHLTKARRGTTVLWSA
jgi:hypothetical protein